MNKAAISKLHVQEKEDRLSPDERLYFSFGDEKEDRLSPDEHLYSSFGDAALDGLPRLQQQEALTHTEVQPLVHHHVAEVNRPQLVPNARVPQLLLRWAVRLPPTCALLLPRFVSYAAHEAIGLPPSIAQYAESGKIALELVCGPFT